MTLQRAIGACVLCGLLLLAKVAGAADADMARVLGNTAERILRDAKMPCEGGVRTVAHVKGTTFDVICGYSAAYRIVLTGPHDAKVTKLDY